MEDVALGGTCCGRGVSREPRVEDVDVGVPVSARDGDLIRGVRLAGDSPRGDVMVAIWRVCCARRCRVEVEAVASS